MQSDQNLTWDKALTHAYRTLPENVDLFAEKVREEGELTGMAKVYANASGVTGGAAVGNSTAGNDPQLPEQDKQVIKALGLDKRKGGKEEYLRVKAKRN